MKIKLASNKYRLIFLMGCIILAGFISYINVYNNQFLWDDEFLIQKNRYIRSFTYLPEIFTTCSGAGAGRWDNFYRPMQLIVYSFVYKLGGLNVKLFHFLNIFLHLGNALLIFFLIKNISKEENVAFLASLLWIVHPVHTSAITSMSGTATPLSVFFGLSSFFFYVIFKDKRKIYLLFLSYIMFGLALLSKEAIIILPLLFFLYEFIAKDEETFWRKYKGIIPFLIIAGGYFLLRLTLLNFGGTLNLYQESNIYTQNISVRIFTFLASLLMYYSFLLFPINLHMEREFPVFVSPFSYFVVASFVILVFLFFITYKSIKSKKMSYAFGILWFFISFLPMSGIIIPVNALLLEHWLYLPSIGFFFVISLLFIKLLKNKSYRTVVFCTLTLIVAASITLSIKSNFVWKDPITFYNNILKYNEGTARVHNNLAMAYADIKDFKSAEKHYLKAIEIADTYPQTHYNLARLYLRFGKIERAISHLERSIEINPNFFFSYQLLGNIYEHLKRYDLANDYYKKAKSIKFY